MDNNRPTLVIRTVPLVFQTFSTFSRFLFEINLQYNYYFIIT